MLITALLLVTLPALVEAGETTQKDHIAIEVQSIKKEFGVQVHYLYLPNIYFPKNWLARPISATGEQLSLDEVNRLLPIIKKFLARNPKEALTKNLSDIYLLSRLEFKGVSFGASNSRTGLYIKSGDASKGFSNEYLLARCHSEFSSILFRNYRFPTDDWNRLNPKGFEYGKSGVEFLVKNGLYGQSDELLRQGFLVKYSQSTLENDFNMISDWLFTKPDDLKKLAGKHDKIKAQMENAINFYRSVDKGYDF